MRRIFLTVAAAGMLAPIGLAAPALAEQPIDAKAEVQRLIDRPINAALLYHRLWTIHDSGISMFRDAVSAEALDFDNPEWVPDDMLAELLEDLQPYIRGLMVAAAEPDADWGIEYREGVEALLPHLRSLRDAARVLRADARRLIEAGEHEAAADRVIAIYRMSTQSRNDGLMISAMVNTAIGAMASMETRLLVVGYDLDPDASRSILRAIDAMPSEDRYGVEYAVAIEPPFFADWIRRTFTDERPGEKLVGAMMIEDGIEAEPVRAMTRAELFRELELYEQFGRDVVRVWNDQEVFVKLGELTRGLRDGEYGHIARLMAPSFTNVRQQAERAERDLQRARAALMQEDD